MNRRGSRRNLVIVLACLVAGCGSSTSAESPPVRGQRVHGTSLVAQGAVPYRVGAYEFAFASPADDGAVAGHARRAALVVDMAAGRGYVRGFIEWARSGHVPLTYVAAGRAQQADVEGEPVTVFELVLNDLETRNGGRRPRSDAERVTPFAVRVVVNEASGEVTLTRRH
jgi:hypothetical protein